MRKAKYISICNQKGGVGKSSFTILLASYLYYTEGLRVGVIDCDYPQHSIVKFRAWEVGQVKTNEYYNRLAEELYVSTGRPVYPVIGAKPESALAIAAELEENSREGYDILFFDLSGTVNNISILDVLDAMDYYFTPIEGDYQVLESSLNFAVGIDEAATRAGKTNRIHLFWNKIDRREKNPLYDRYEKDVIHRLGLPLMRGSFPLSLRFRKVMNGDTRQFLVSTIFPATRAVLKDTNIDVRGFVKEIISIINITQEDERFNKEGVQGKVPAESPDRG